MNSRRLALGACGAALLGGVAYAAHVGGFVAGLLLIKLFMLGLPEYGPAPYAGDYDEPRALAREFAFTLPLRTRGEERREKMRHAGAAVRRWAVERTHSCPGFRRGSAAS